MNPMPTPAIRRGDQPHTVSDDSAFATSSIEESHPKGQEGPGILPFRTCAQLRAEEDATDERKQVRATYETYRAIEGACLASLTFDLMSREIEEPVRLERCVRHYLQCLRRHDVQLLAQPKPEHPPQVISPYLLYYLTVSHFLPRLRPLPSSEQISDRVEIYFRYCTAVLAAKRWTLSRNLEEER